MRNSVLFSSALFSLALLSAAVFLTACSETAPSKAAESSFENALANNAWFVAARKQIENKADVFSSKSGQAKNIILFVGDGMSLSTIAAARIMEGQQRGESGEENQLSFERFPYIGLAKTYNVDAQTPDSAGTMTAMMSGVKTDMGLVGLTEFARRGHCEPGQHQAPTALEYAELAGMATGIVTTARMTHATPAATYAHSADRNWEDISDMPEATIRAGCLDIADQFIRFPQLTTERYGIEVDGPEVVFGGGRRHFLPKNSEFNSADAVSAIEGDRTDGRHLIDEWKSAHPQGLVLFDQTGFNQLTKNNTSGPVFGLFNESHMRFEADRANDISGEPSLSEMTSKAIELLEDNKNGYFLMVESGRIDHAHHVGSAFNALNETVELAEAVRIATEKTDADDTLIIVTADHGHVMTFAGYPRRGNPILGKVVNPGENQAMLAADGMPYTTLSYANGLGYYEDSSNDTGDDPEARYASPHAHGRHDLSKVDTEAHGYHQEALVPLSAETHSGEDVAVYARGPGAELVSGAYEQNVIFHVMNRAASLTEKAAARLAESNIVKN
jgi:alkaline phosphatase